MSCSDGWGVSCLEDGTRGWTGMVGWALCSEFQCIMVTWEPPLPPGQTDTYENITFPQLRRRALNIKLKEHLQNVTQLRCNHDSFCSGSFQDRSQN